MQDLRCPESQIANHESPIDRRRFTRAKRAGRRRYNEVLDFLSSLNPEQQEAVLHTDGPLLILAGAGSGKTRVIAHRIANLVANGNIAPDRVLAVTFTNKAAEEMRTRVETLLGMDCRQMWISTFHALCARLLRREAPHIGLSRDFVIYDSADQLTVMKQALKEVGVDDSTLAPRLALSRISHAKNRMEGLEAFTSNSWNPREQQIGKLYEIYVRTLKDSGPSMRFFAWLIRDSAIRG